MTLQTLAVWAAGLTPAYLEGALARALDIAHAPAVIGQLAAAEYEALDDAELLEMKAAVERSAADTDEAAAEIARLDAERLRQERLATEEAIGETAETAATLEADLHEGAAREARDAADAAAQRRRAAQRKRTQAPQRKRKK